MIVWLHWCMKIESTWENDCDCDLKVWPYLLGHYPFGSTADEREAQDKAVQAAYEATMSEWLAVEAIIRQRDKEITAARIAKISSGSQSGSQHPHDMTLNGQGRSLSNEVIYSYTDMFIRTILNQRLLKKHNLTRALTELRQLA